MTLYGGEGENLKYWGKEKRDAKQMMQKGEARILDVYIQKDSH